jgi:iron complex transport system substrate-binding protein
MRPSRSDNPPWPSSTRDTRPLLRFIAAAPDVILASWCGKKVVPEKIRQRPGWGQIPAVRNDGIVEIKSPLILQPGPAALTDGLDAILAALGRGS